MEKQFVDVFSQCKTPSSVIKANLGMPQLRDLFLDNKYGRFLSQRLSTPCGVTTIVIIPVGYDEAMKYTIAIVPSSKCALIASVSHVLLEFGSATFSVGFNIANA